jgi:pimeloyl-ACP methyl ester carboxylesterase
MDRIRTDTLDIAYTSGGPEAGFPVLLLHGWPDAPDAWAGVTPALEAAGYRWIAPWLRGFGPTSFLDADTPRDGSAAALASDALDLADALGIGRFAVLGHDWGGRTAYALSAIAPERIAASVVLAIGYTPHGRFVVPDFEQSARWWYQWLMTSDAGAAKVAADPIGFARAQWDTWSPPGWFDEASFAKAAEDFRNPDWVAITLHGYRYRWGNEPLDPRYAAARAAIAATERLNVATLLLQGGDDRCDPPSETEAQVQGFAGHYERLVLAGVGHFPAREAPDAVAKAAIAHFRRFC